MLSIGRRVKLMSHFKILTLASKNCRHPVCVKTAIIVHFVETKADLRCRAGVGLERQDGCTVYRVGMPGVGGGLKDEGFWDWC